MAPLEEAAIYGAMWKFVLVAAFVLVIAGAGNAYWSYRKAGGEAEAALASIAIRATPPNGAFDGKMTAGLPEIAQRYFKHAISPQTVLRTTVMLEMEGTFLLGDKAKFQTFAFNARQILAPPAEFVWIPSMHSGLVHISGSDALVQGVGWTRFWINSLLPVVNMQGSADLNRSALTRSAIEAIWAPASLLPANGVIWKQTGLNTARLTFPTGTEPVDLTLGSDGRVVAVVTMRWSNANADKTFRLQPFGGTMEAEQSFGGFTIPSVVKVGNLYGSSEYLAFFQASITHAKYL